MSREVPDRLDVRLLLPALAAWGVLVAAQSWPRPGVAPYLWATCLAVLGAGVVVVSLRLGAVRQARKRGQGAETPRAQGTRPGGSPQPARPSRQRTRPGGHPRLAWRHRRRPPRRRRRPAVAAPGASMIVLSGVLTALVCLAAAAHVAVRDAGPIPELARERAVVTVQGRIDEDPRLLRTNGEREQQQVAVRLLVTQVSARGVRTRVRTSVVLLGSTQLASLGWRDEVRVRGRLRAAEPGERVAAILQVSGRVERIGGGGVFTRMAAAVRADFRQAVAPLPEDPRGLVPGLVLGDRSLTPDQLSDDMLVSGMSHLTAVSGSNVSVILAAALLLAGACGVPRRARPLMCGLVLAGFVVLVRPDPSVIRAATMGAVGLIGLSASRRAAGPPALGAAVVALLLVDPWLARSYGFALSSLATLGLLLFARSWGEWLARPLPERLRFLGEATAIPVAAQVACAPVVVLLQGSVPLVGIPANLLAAPLVAPATVAGVVAALTAAVWVPAGTLAAWVAALPAWGIAAISHFFAALPGGTLPWPDGVPGALLLAALSLAALGTFGWMTQQIRRRPWWSLAILLAVVLAAWPVPGPRPPTRWVFAACDVGQGDALVVATGPGAALLVDAGPDPAAVDACLQRLGVRRLDAVVLTHFHADHVSGLAGALHGRPAGALYVSPLAEPAAETDEVRRRAADLGLTPVPLQAGERRELGGIAAVVRWPARIVRSGSLPNNSGLVLDIQAAGVRLLLLADVEREAAAAVAAQLRQEDSTGATSGVDIVKVAHHGSANQDRGLIDLVKAPVAVLSVGRDNTYGHPARSTLTAYARTGARILRTDRDGDIVIARTLDRPVEGVRYPGEGLTVQRGRG